MKGKITNTTSNDPGKKPVSSSKWKNLGAAIVFTASVLSTNLGFNQNTQLPIDQQKNKGTIELVEKNDSIDHEKFIHMDADSVVAEYWLEVLNKHLLIEINNVRKEFNDTELIPDSAGRTLQDLTLNQKLCTSAQAYAEYMYNNNRYDHKGADWSTFESRIKKTWYPFKFLWEILYKKWWSIADIVAWRKKSQTHHNAITNRYYLHAGFWYYNWYRVGHFGWQQK